MKIEQIVSIEYLERDWDTSRRMERCIDRILLENPAIRSGSRSRGGSGSLFLGSMREEIRQSYGYLLDLENFCVGNGNFVASGAQACRILEATLRDVLAAPCLREIQEIIDALRRSPKNSKQGDILDAWAAGNKPDTLGTHCLLLLGLRRGWQFRHEGVCKLLQSNFHNTFRDMLASSEFLTNLNMLTARRNPLAHLLEGGGEVTSDEYAELCRGIAGNVTFELWNSEGPAPNPPSNSEAILFHHIASSKQFAPRNMPWTPRDGSPA